VPLPRQAGHPGGADLVEGSKYPPGSCYAQILGFVDKNICCPKLARLVREILEENAELFQKMPAAQLMHHGFSGGLVEHVWSVTRVAISLIKHNAVYYDTLNPPLDRDVVVAAAILHDIGKLRELACHPVEAKYTKHGTLIGHVVLGRDMIRDKAREIGEFPEETLLLLEHAILAHHGLMQYGAPKEPSTIEALIVHYADEIDAKINAVAAERMKSTTEGEFTGKIWAVGNRMFYKGIPVEAPSDDDIETLP
jgi:3'-5' exoribonuclease